MVRPAWQADLPRQFEPQVCMMYVEQGLVGVVSVDKRLPREAHW